MKTKILRVSMLLAVISLVLGLLFQDIVWFGIVSAISFLSSWCLIFIKI